MADYGVRTPPCPMQSSAEEGSGTGSVPLVTQQNIHDLPVLTAGGIEVALLFAAEAKNFIHVPAPAATSPVVVECLSQLRPKGLHPRKHGTSGNINLPLSPELPHMGGRQGVSGIPPNSGPNHSGRPAITGKRGLRVGRQIPMAGVAGIPLTAVCIIPITLSGRLVAAGAMNHRYARYHAHQLTSQTPKECSR